MLTWYPHDYFPPPQCSVLTDCYFYHIYSPTYEMPYFDWMISLFDRAFFPNIITIRPIFSKWFPNNRLVYICSPLGVYLY